MTLRVPTIMIGALLLLSPLLAEDPPATKTPALKRASAHGVSLDYPAELTFTTEVDDAGTKLKFKKDSELPWILVQVFSVDVTPAKVLEVYLRNQRDVYEEKNRQIKEQPTRETIAGQSCLGTEFLFTTEGIEFRQRYLTLIVDKRTVLVMTLSKTSEDAMTRELLLPIASSIH